MKNKSAQKNTRKFMKYIQNISCNFIKKGVKH